MNQDRRTTSSDKDERVVELSNSAQAATDEDESSRVDIANAPDLSQSNSESVTESFENDTTSALDPREEESSLANFIGSDSLAARVFLELASRAYSTLRSAVVEFQLRAIGAYASIPTEPQIQWEQILAAASATHRFPAGTNQFGMPASQQQLALPSPDEFARIRQYESHLLSMANVRHGSDLQALRLQPTLAQLTASLPLQLPGSNENQSCPHDGTSIRQDNSTESLTAMAIQQHKFDRATLSGNGCSEEDKKPAAIKQSQSVNANTIHQSPSKPSELSVDNDEPHQAKRAAQQIQRARKRRKYSHESFPSKLIRLLHETAIAGRSGVISFTSSGRAFRVHDPEAFARDIAPIYFRHNQYSSFQRQLSMYGFERIQSGPENGAYTHPLFQRAQPHLAAEISRVGDLEVDDFQRQPSGSSENPKHHE